ncbi:MAG TPA: RNA 2',3'-cyclic phosphodiesterase [Candidatus Cloacimonetes bacterium]|nr:RNA 2',3'-cyclic phosphodiesterase [Candidatus Cloacimonadota bacterium]
MRLFLALEPPQEIIDELCQTLVRFQRFKHNGINWVKPENLHLTVNFIGDTPDHLVDDLWDEIELAAKQYPASTLKAEGYELFPDRFPRVLWLKLSSDDRYLEELSRKVKHIMREKGLDVNKKKLKLHVTLGRLKQAQSPYFEEAVLSYPINELIQKWDRLSLYESFLLPNGPRYKLLKQYKFE